MHTADGSRTHMVEIERVQDSRGCEIRKFSGGARFTNTAPKQAMSLEPDEPDEPGLTSIAACDKL